MYTFNLKINLITALMGKHLLAIFFSVFVGALILGPQLVFITMEGTHYQGLYMMTTDAEDFYLARIHEYYDEGRVGNPYLYEYKFYGPMFYSFGAETLLAIPGKLFNISVPTLNLIYKFMLPALQFLLAYALLFRLSGSRLWSIAGGIMVFTGLVWFDWDYLKNNIYVAIQSGNFQDLWYRVPGPLYVGRPVHPQFSQLHLLLYLHALLSFISTAGKRQNNYALLLATLLALSFYTYFYSFTFFLTVNGVLITYWLLSKNFARMSALLCSTLGGLLFGMPPLYAIYSAMHHPDYTRVAKALWVMPSHHFVVSFSTVSLAVLLGIYYYIQRKEKSAEFQHEKFVFVFALIIAGFVVVNQQVLSGVTLQYVHYFRSIIYPIDALLFFLLVHLYSRYFFPDNIHKLFFFRNMPWVAITLLVSMGIFIQYIAYRNDALITSGEQRLMPAIKWLAEHTQKESVIMANQRLSELIPVFTANNVMWVDDYISAGFLVPAERAQFTPEQLLQSDDFYRDAKKYRLDYILWDKESNPDWRIERYKLTQLYSASGLEIYLAPR